MFTDRTGAGERLAAHLQERGVSADVVLAVPRGGLPVARPVADALDARLSVVVARKLGAPANPELAIGAVAADGSVWYNDDLVARLGVDDEYLQRVVEKERAAAEEKLARYPAGGRDLDGLRVLVVDDGVATGATIRACLRQVRATDAAWVGLAVPVGPPDSLVELEREADAVYALETPRRFGAVGAHYRDFSQVTDEEAIEYLEQR